MTYRTFLRKKEILSWFLMGPLITWCSSGDFKGISSSTSSQSDSGTNSSNANGTDLNGQGTDKNGLNTNGGVVIGSTNSGEKGRGNTSPDSLSGYQTDTSSGRLGNDALDSSTNKLSVQQVLNLCGDGSSNIQSGTAALSYPPTQECPFGVQDNGTERDQYLQARVKVDRTIPFPDGAVICSIELASNSQIQYDDVMVVSLNDYVLISSDNNLTNVLDFAEGLRKWDFTKVRGTPSNFEGGDYCLGEPNSTCVLPGHDINGRITINLDSQSLAPLSAKVSKAPSKSLSVITLGDNDPGDCEHTGINFNLNYTYIMPNQ